MRATSFLAAIAVFALLSGCSQQAGAQGGGPGFGPMMGYGYCPGAPDTGDQAGQGWRGPGMMMGRGGMMGGGRMGGPMHGADPQQTASWLDSASREIGVTGGQQQAWSAYAEAVQADRAAMAAMHAQMPAMMGDANADAPARLAAHTSFMQARLESLQRVQAASEALYSVLTPEQRTRANRALWSGCW